MPSEEELQDEIEAYGRTLSPEERQLEALSQFVWCGLHPLIACRHRASKKRKRGVAPCAPCARDALDNLHIAMKIINPDHDRIRVENTIRKLVAG